MAYQTNYQVSDVEVGDEVEHEFKCPDCASDGITCYTILVSSCVDPPKKAENDHSYQDTSFGEFTGHCTGCSQAEAFDLIQITAIHGKTSSRLGDGLW